MSPAGTALPLRGLGKWLGLPYLGGRERGREGASGCPTGPDIAGQILPAGWLLFPHWRVGSLALPRASVPAGDATRLPSGAIMDAPFGGKWTAGEGRGCSLSTGLTSCQAHLTLGGALGC